LRGGCEEYRALQYLRSITSNLGASSGHSKPQCFCVLHPYPGAARHVLVLVIKPKPSDSLFYFTRAPASFPTRLAPYTVTVAPRSPGRADEQKSQRWTMPVIIVTDLQHREQFGRKPEIGPCLHTFHNKDLMVSRSGVLKWADGTKVRTSNLRGRLRGKAASLLHAWARPARRATPSHSLVSCRSSLAGDTDHGCL